MKYRALRVIISGGGTGGHIFPAVSIANKLKELNPETEILFVGAEGRMEMERVPAAGYRIIGLPVAGLQRKLTLSNLALPFKVIRSLRMAKKRIREFNPDITATRACTCDVTVCKEGLAFLVIVLLAHLLDELALIVELAEVVRCILVQNQCV